MKSILKIVFSFLVCHLVAAGSIPSIGDKRAVCGGTLYGSGYILTPNYPNDYPNDVKCTWYLESNAEQFIELRFETFSTEFKLDFVSVWEDWDPENGTVLVDKESGTKEPFIVGSFSTNRLVVEFTSDESVTAKGFLAFFTGQVKK